jgi:hypothetical protein
MMKHLMQPPHSVPWDQAEMGSWQFKIDSGFDTPEQRLVIRELANANWQREVKEKAEAAAKAREEEKGADQKWKKRKWADDGSDGKTDDNNSWQGGGKKWQGAGNNSWQGGGKGWNNDGGKGGKGKQLQKTVDLMADKVEGIETQVVMINIFFKKS